MHLDPGVFWWRWTCVGPSPHHPRPMLINLQTFDVDPGQDIRYRRRDDQNAHERARSHIAAKRMRRNNNGARARHEREQDDGIPVQAMEEDGLVPNHGDKLQHDEHAGRQDGEEVQHHADLEGVLQVEVAFARGGRVAGRVAAEDGAVGEVLEAGEGEGEDVAEGEEGLSFASVVAGVMGEWGESTYRGRHCSPLRSQRRGRSFGDCV